MSGYALLAAVVCVIGCLHPDRRTVSSARQRMTILPLGTGIDRGQGWGLVVEAPTVAMGFLGIHEQKQERVVWVHR